MIDADLPDQGSWPGPLHAPLGTMLVSPDGNEVTCHVCGRKFRALWKHIQTHGLDAETYRAYFGLRVGEPLCAPKMADARAEISARQPQDPARVEALRQRAAEFTAEQRSVWSRAREARLQTQIESGRGDPEIQRSRAQAWHAKREQDPQADEAWRKAIRARRKRLDAGRKCVVCGAEFCVLSSRQTRQISARKTCGAPECKREVKRRAQLASAAARRRARERL